MPDALPGSNADATHSAFDRLVGAGELDLGREGLVDALGAQAGLKLGLDQSRMRRLTTGAP